MITRDKLAAIPPVAKVAIKAGAEVPFMRPSKLSQDLSTTEETLKHALVTYEALISKKFDICIIVFVFPMPAFKT